VLQKIRRIITENVLLLSRRYRLKAAAAAAMDSVAAVHGEAGEIRRCTGGVGDEDFSRAYCRHTRVTVTAPRRLLSLWSPTDTMVRR